MKRTKKNNKGFSLVELIVVVLIMAIIAVALAPQVMKWVDTSRVNTDNHTLEAMKSNVQDAILDMQVNELTTSLGATITISNTGTAISGVTGDGTTLTIANALEAVVPGYTTAVKTKTGGAVATITVTGGSITAATLVDDKGVSILK